LNGSPVKQGKNLRMGYEQTEAGTDLVVWLKHEASESFTIEINPLDE